jgi:hypothetical protein
MPEPHWTDRLSLGVNPNTETCPMQPMLVCCAMDHSHCIAFGPFMWYLTLSYPTPGLTETTSWAAAKPQSHEQTVLHSPECLQCDKWT